MWDVVMAAGGVRGAVSAAWRCVGRSEEMARVSKALAGPAGGVVFVTGEPGTGRTTFINLVLDRLDLTRSALLHVPTDAGGTPLAALRPYLRGDLAVPGPWPHTAAAIAAELAGRFGARRPVVVADDAHRMDLTSMLVLRQLQRTHGAMLLLTTPRSVTAPDPSDCVRYEPNVIVVDLPPLTRADVACVLTEVFGDTVRRSTATALHVLSGGNPGRLRRLLAQRGPAGAIDQETAWGAAICGRVAHRSACSATDLDRMRTAMSQAWAALDLDTVVEIGQLMRGFGTGAQVAAMHAGAQVAAMHAGALLLRGWPAEAERVLADWEPDLLDDDNACRLVVTRAMNQALGLDDPAQATHLLTHWAERMPRWGARLLAYRAWLLALDGQLADAARGADAAVRSVGDHEAQLLARTAMGTVAMMTGRPGAAVANLRRALAMAERLREDLPWLPAYLTGCLIEALLRAGRSREAASMATEFQAGRNGGEAGQVLSIPAGRWQPTAGRWQPTDGRWQPTDGWQPEPEPAIAGRMRRAG